MTDLTVLWHDLECGGYDVDLPLWRDLAERGGGPVLDVGAGTGRVSLDLAARGHDVVALDAEQVLLDALAERAAESALTIETVCCDARDLSRLAGRDFALVIVPMQTLQLLGDVDGRSAFLTGARAAMRPDAILSAALADALDGFDETSDVEPPLPDMLDLDGFVYSSLPVAVRDLSDGVVIERLREIVTPDGTRMTEEDRIRLTRVDAAAVAREAEPLGFVPLAPTVVAATEEYVGSEVVMLRAR